MDFIPTPPTSPRETPAPQTMERVIPEMLSAGSSHSAPEVANLSGDANSPPWIGEDSGGPNVAGSQPNATAIRSSAATSREDGSQAAAGSSHDAMQARKLNVSPAAIRETISPPASRSSSSGNALRADSECDASEGARSSVSRLWAGSGLTPVTMGANPSSPQLKGEKTADGNTPAVSGATVFGGPRSSEPDSVPSPVVPPAKSAVLPGDGKESASNSSTLPVASPGKSSFVPDGGKRSAPNASTGARAMPGKPAIVSGGAKKPQTNLSISHESSVVPNLPATISEAPTSVSRSAELFAATVVPMAAPEPNLDTNVRPLRSVASPRSESRKTQANANVGAIPSGSGASGAQQSFSRSSAVAPAIQPDSADHLKAGLNTKLEHVGLPVATVDSMVHAPSSPRSELNQSVGAASIAGSHAASAVIATRLPAASTDPSHVPIGAAFERMDSAAAPQVIENSSRHLAVGVRNADLGWVEIRTSNAAGQVSATLTTGSIESHNAVAAQLPSMREYLAAQQVRVDHLASENFSASSDRREASSGDQSRDDEGARTAKVAEEAIPARASVTDADQDGLSYINVRV